ncbi:MAG: PilN domain-containing protein [Elusimicrobia bacterium]|nr:PilN domain-containing protein [Elusimicrobiota bacterium]
MIRVNLVPSEILDREVQRLRRVQASIIGGLLAVALILLSLLHYWSALSHESQVAELDRKLDKLAKIVAQVEEAERAANAVKVRLNVINGLLKGRPLYPYFMSDLMGTMPPTVWLTSLATAAKDPSGLTVTITNAVSSTPDGVSQWLRNFETSGKFEEPKLTAIAVTEKGEAKEYTFTIATSYKNPSL